MRWTGIRGGFPLLLLLICALLVVSTLGFYFLELHSEKGDTLLSALWWTVVTLTTVGYGDLVPSTAVGRILGIGVMLSGVCLVSAFTGSLASMLVEYRARKRKGLLEVKMYGHVIIVGWNPHGSGLVKSLKETGVLSGNTGLVLVNDLDAEGREQIANELDFGEKLRFVKGNPSQESVMRKARPDAAKVVYIMTQAGLELKEADQQSLCAALVLRDLSPKVDIYGEVALTENREHLLRAGVNETIVGGELSSKVLGMMGANLALWTLLQDMIGIHGQELLGFRPLDREEKQGVWGDMARSIRSRDGSLPLALCQVSKDISLQDVLDEESALDKFILDLFESSGQSTKVGRQGPRVVVNPPDEEPLGAYDVVLLLKGASGAPAEGTGEGSWA